MARIRSIKPEFWTDRRLARLSRDARLLYISLWNQADEWARIHGDTRFIKGHCLPYDDDLSLAAIDALLGELEAAGRVQRYSIDGDPYLYLPKLGTHQRLEPGKLPSRHPEPPEPGQTSHDTPSSGVGADQSARNPDQSAPSPDQSGTIVALQGAGGRGQVASGRAQDSAAQITGRYVEGLKQRPPKTFVAQLAAVIRGLVEDDIDPRFIERGLALWSAKASNPGSLPSFVNEAMNPPAHQSTANARAGNYLALADYFDEGETG